MVSERSRKAVGPQSKAWRQLFRKQFLKTKLCRFYPLGECRYSTECPYAHNASELESTPDLTKTALCIAFEKGSCMKASEDCQFAHGREELRTTQAFSTSTLCRRPASEEDQFSADGEVGFTSDEQVDEGLDGASNSSLAQKDLAVDCMTSKKSGKVQEDFPDLFTLFKETSKFSPADPAPGLVSENPPQTPPGTFKVEDPPKLPISPAPKCLNLDRSGSGDGSIEFELDAAFSRRKLSEPVFINTTALASFSPQAADLNQIPPGLRTPTKSPGLLAPQTPSTAASPDLSSRFNSPVLCDTPGSDLSSGVGDSFDPSALDARLMDLRLSDIFGTPAFDSGFTNPNFCPTFSPNPSPNFHTGAGFDPTAFGGFFRSDAFRKDLPGGYPSLEVLPF